MNVDGDWATALDTADGASFTGGGEVRFPPELLCDAHPTHDVEEAIWSPNQVVSSFVSRVCLRAHQSAGFDWLSIRPITSGSVNP